MRRLLPVLVLAALPLFPAPSRGEEKQELRISSLPRGCGICHLDRVPARERDFSFLSLGTAEATGSRRVCYSCHNGIVRDSRRYIWSGRQHRADDPTGSPGRGGRAACGTCHDPHTQTEGVGTFMRYARGYSGHCVECHPERGGGNRGEHPAAGRGSGREGGCETCHQIHQAAGRGLVRAGSEGQLCVSCHGENPSRKGKGPGEASHPVDGRRLVCTTCHSPHRSARDGLVRQEAVDSSLCRQCHADHGSEASGKANHPLRPGGVECLSCHRSHNAPESEGKLPLLAEPLETLDSLCRHCHPAGGGKEGKWDHPVGIADHAARENSSAKLAEYGGLFGADSEILCLSCHRSHNGTQDTAQLVVSRQALCLYCHTAQNSLAPNLARFGTHPISVKPERASIAASLLERGGKVGRGGELTCLTCHLTHGGEKDAAGLVLAPDEYTCTLCHAEKSETSSTPHNLDGGRTESCLGCHGHHGWSIPLDEVSMGGSVIERVCWYCHGPEGSAPMEAYFGHIVGIPLSGSMGAARLPLFWEDGRRLLKGLITCATCHDPHRSPSGSFLRLEDDERRSDLCLNCHKKQEVVKETKHDVAMYFPGQKNRRGENAGETGPCAACHLVHSSGPGKSWARSVSSAAGGEGEIAAFCADCHREGSLAQGKIIEERLHPHQDSLAERPVAEPVECSGCHDVHQWNPMTPSDRGDFFTGGDGSNSFLVAPAAGGSRLCLRCHEDKAAVQKTKHDFSGVPKRQGDGSLCGSCHLPHGGEPVLMWPTAPGADELYGSHTCLPCHGQGEAGGPSFVSDSSHPVGVSLPSDPGEALPLYLPSGQRYHSGKVSCGTCHDPHNWAPTSREGVPPSPLPGPTTSFLRIAADGFSPLCFPCHSESSMVVGTDHDLRITAPAAANLDGLTADESGVCGSCHRVHNAPSLPGLWNRGLGEGRDPQSTYCRSCHGEGGLKEATAPRRLEAHLVHYPGQGMVSRVFTRRVTSVLDLSTSFPLYSPEGEVSDRGVISCATCHDPHLWEPDTQRSGTGIPQDGDMKNSFLKVKSTFAIGRSFCQECHGDDTLEFFQRYHFPVEEPAGEAP